MKDSPPTIKGYTTPKTALFVCYYIALMPFITTILKFITNLFTKEPNILGFMHGGFYVLIVLTPLIFICFDLYPIVMGKRTKTPFKEHLKTHPELYVLAAFLVWNFIAGISQIVIFKKSSAFVTAILPHGIIEGFPLFIYYALCLMMAFLIKDRKTSTNILFIVLISSLILGICSIIDPSAYYLGNSYYSTDWSSLFLNSNHYGYFLTMCVMASATIWCTATKKWLKISAIYATSFLLIIMMLNNTFGCLIAIFISLILLAVVLCLFKNKFDWKYLLPAGIFVVISVLVTPIARFFNSTYNSFFSQCYNLIKELFVIADNPVSDAAKQAGTSRWDLWLKAFSEICSSPLIGTGDVTLRPHNEYLQYAVVWGLPSLIIYLSAFVIIFVKAIKSRKSLSNLTLVCLFTVGGYLVSALFGNTMPHTMPYFMLFLGFLIRWLNSDILNNKNKTIQTDLIN